MAVRGALTTRARADDGTPILLVSPPNPPPLLYQCSCVHSHGDREEPVLITTIETNLLDRLKMHSQTGTAHSVPFLQPTNPLNQIRDSNCDGLEWCCSQHERLVGLGGAWEQPFGRTARRAWPLFTPVTSATTMKLLDISIDC